MTVTNTKHNITLAGFILCLVFSTWSPAFAGDPNDGLSLGLTGGYGNWDIKTPAQKIDGNASSVGLALRYTTPLDGDAFAGIHLGLQKDQLSKTVGNGPLTVKTETDWSLDLLGRIGMNAGSVSPYLAAGPSLVNISASARQLDQAVKAENRHLGYKLVAGMDIPVTDNISSFIQAEYADYGSKTYNFGNISAKADPKNMGVRAGLLYSF